MKKIINNIKDKVAKKDLQEVSLSNKITNSTLEEQRQEILNKGRKFKYPVQYSKNKLIINTILIATILFTGGFALTVFQLYKVQNDSDLMYRITSVFPFSVAVIDGSKASFSDYLLEYRLNMTYINKHKDIVEGANDIDTLSKHYKRQSLDNTIMNALAAKIAKENNITVSETEVNDYFNQLKKTQNGDISENTFYAIVKNNYNISPSEYRRIFIELPLLRQKVSAFIDKDAENIKNQISQFLKENKNDFSKLVEKFGEKIEVGNSGVVKKTNIDGGKAKRASELNIGGVSEPFISSSGDGYYFVKTIKKNETDVSYDYIKIPFKEFKNSKYSLIIIGKTIKIYFENNEKEYIITDNISYVRFYAIVLGRGRRDRNPTLQIFDSEEKILVEMTIKPIDYYSLKKYFEKYNVRIDNQYREF